MEYQLRMNLRQRAALRAAISFWEKKEVQDKVTEFFKSCHNMKIRKAENKWHKFTKTVVDEWNKDLLPRNLEIELIHIIKMIGETIFNWFLYIKYEYEAEDEAINCIDKIHWTPFGTLDTVKIFKTYWLDNPNFDTTKLYHFACSHMLKEHIDDLWHKNPSGIRNYSILQNYQRFDRHILVYWELCRFGGLPDLMRYSELVASVFNGQDMHEFNLIYDLDRSLEENMLRLSVHQGYFIAVKYFWEKITEMERNDSILKCACIAIIRYHYYGKESQSIQSYRKSQYIEICIFLMNQMNKDHKKIFFNEKIQFDDGIGHDYYMYERDLKIVILEMLLSTWPWQELFMPVLKDMVQYQDDNILSYYSKMDCMFLDDITFKMLEDHHLGYVSETSRYRGLLREAWLIVPAFIKKKIVDEYSDLSFICNLVYLWDMDMLKLILNDPGIADVKHLFIYGGWESYEEFVTNDQFEKLDQLMEVITQSEEDEKSFKESLDNWFSLLLAHRFDLVDKLLDWRCSTPEQRKSTKDEIDHIDICDTLIDNNEFDLIDKVLDWKFDTEEEKRNCKKHFRSSNVSIKKVFSIWDKNKDNIEEAKEVSSKFLNWILESKEKIERFKKKTLVNLERNELVMVHLVQLKRIGIMNDFLFWCLSDGKKVRRIKQILSQSNQRL